MGARLFQQFFIALGGARLQSGDMNKQLLLKIEQEQAHPRPVYRVTRHQLRVRKPLVNVLIDDV